MTPWGGPLGIATLPNLRDVGGWRTVDGGEVRRGVLYRSVALDRLDDAGLAALAGLGVRTVYDLRTASERAARPDRLPHGAQLVGLDVLADGYASAASHMLDVLQDPTWVLRELGEGKALVAFRRAYRDLVDLPSAMTSYAQLYAQLADAEQRPALIHCTAGKDRTGWAAAALLTWLGVSAEDVMADYLATNSALLPVLEPVFQRFADAGGQRDILEQILGVRPEYLQTALAAVHERYGSIDAYVSHGLGVPEQVRRRLRAAFLETD